MTHRRIACARLGAALGMLMALLVGLAGPGRAEEPSYPPVSRLGIRTAPLLLLTRPDVQADLRLAPEAVHDAERLVADLHARAAALRGKTGAEVLAARRSIDEAQERWLNTQLTEPQRKRLIQIDLQWEGPSALVSRPVVAESLALTADQRARLTKAVAERKRQRAQGHNQPADERPLGEQALSVLTAEQKAQWKEMLGRPFVPHDPDPTAGPDAPKSEHPGAQKS